MTDYNTRLREIKVSLDKTGPGYCLAKWYHVSMHLHTGTNHSCYHPSPHFVALDEIQKHPAALHNSDYKKQQRKAMLEGERPSECSYCWDIEDLPGNQISDRMLRSSEPWAVPLLESTRVIDWNADVSPRYLEVNFGYECQLKCSYCASTVSSAWHSEIKKHGDYPLENDTNRRQYGITQITQAGRFFQREDGNPYIEAFWKWFPSVYDTLHTLRVTGGEPLLSSNVFKVLDWIDQHPRPDMEFAINSNMCIPERNLNKFVDYCKRLKAENKIGNLSLFTSVDTWGIQAEWIRNGFNMEKWESNIDLYLTQVPGTNVGIMITFCFLSIPKFNLLLDKILEMRRKYSTKYHQRIWFDTPYLIEPPHLSSLIADDKMIAHLNSTLAYMKTLVKNGDPYAFDDTEYAKLERVVRWIEHNRYQGEELNINRRDFVAFVKEHDTRRETDFNAAFPELEYFCKNIND
jgi:pyruvate-formate lyase-activating enzyme